MSHDKNLNGCSLAKNVKNNYKLSTAGTVVFIGQKDEWSKNSENISWDKNDNNGMQ